MSALFDFELFDVTLLLFICTCTYVRRESSPQLMDSHRTGLRGLPESPRACARLSPWVAASCLVMGAHMFWTGGGQ